MRCVSRSMWLFAAVTVIAAMPAAGQCREARLGWEPFPDAPTVFHADIVIDGDTAAVVRKISNDERVTIHRLVAGEWVYTQDLPAPFDGTTHARGMSMENGWLAVGAGPNRIYFFEQVAGSWEGRGFVEDPLGGLGYSVDLDDAALQLVAGDSSFAHGGLQNAGRVVVFARTGSNWNKVTQLVSKVPEANAAFGNSAAIDGNRIVVGAYGTQKGAIETFRRVAGVWEFERRYRQQGSTNPSGFGWIVDIDGERLAVGAPFGGSANNRAYVYRRDPNGWNVEATLEGAFGTEFGKQVSLDGDRLAVSEHGNDDIVLNGGAVHLYTRSGTTWTPATILRAADAQPGVSFGSGLASSGEQVVVKGQSFPSQRIGGVYAFTNAWSCPTPDFGVPYCQPGAVNSTGFGAGLSAHGSPFVVDGLLGLWAGSLPPGETSLLIASLTPGQVTVGQGTLCLGGSIARINDQVQSADALGRAHFRVRLDAVPANPMQPILAGQTWYFQCYYRDHIPASTFNFSDAVSVPFQ